MRSRAWLECFGALGEMIPCRRRGRSLIDRPLTRSGVRAMFYSSGVGPMYKKMNGRRRDAFLRALEVSGNQTLAAERACVSRSWVCKERGLNPAFDSACRAAIEAADERLRAVEGNRSKAKGWGHLDGVELVVRGSNRRRAQIARARPGQWTARSEDRFLQVFAATCNARAAYEAAGKSKGSAYSHRRRWPAFARRWEEAEKMGSIRVELALVEAAGNPFSTVGQPPLVAMPARRADEMMITLWLHQYRTARLGRPPGRVASAMPIEKACRKILKCVEAVERGAALSEADKARDRREFERRRPASFARHVPATGVSVRGTCQPRAWHVPGTSAADGRAAQKA